MIFLFGTSSKTFQLAMLNLLCGSCGNPSAHALRKRVTKFTLFFIPLFPVAPAKHTLQCTFCGALSELSRENAEQLMAQGGHGGAQAQQDAGAPRGQGNPFAQGSGQSRNPYQS